MLRRYIVENLLLVVDNTEDTFDVWDYPWHRFQWVLRISFHKFLHKKLFRSFQNYFSESLNNVNDCFNEILKRTKTVDQIRPSENLVLLLSPNENPAEGNAHIGVTRYCLKYSQQRKYSLRERNSKILEHLKRPPIPHWRLASVERGE